MSETRVESGHDSIRTKLGDFRAKFDSHFEALLTPSRSVPDDLLQAIRYSALAPGKRIRPYLAMRCCMLSGGKAEDARVVGAAVECVHVFSLIHDDLPAMDDDDLRRGKATSHKKFGEAIAILAGDALVVLAFELLVEHTKDKSLAAEMVLELARRTGWSGMIGGQTADILGEREAPTLERARYIHDRKTGALFEAACRLGAMAGHAPSSSAEALGRFGRHLGRAFQIADDILDVTSATDIAGKGVTKDERAGKQTFPRCLGVERSRDAAREASSEAVAELARFGTDADDLRALVRFVVDRNS